jgi:hypothetical protein
VLRIRDGNIQIRNPRRTNPDPGFGINIPEPQHCTKCGFHSCRGKFAEQMIDALKQLSAFAKNKLKQSPEISNFQQKF